MRGKQEKAFAEQTKRAWNCFSRTLGLVTFANCRMSSSDLSSCAKRRISQSMEAGFRDSLEQRDQKASWTYLVSLLPKRKRSLRLHCAKAKDGCRDCPAPPPSSAFRDLPWSRRSDR